MRVDAVSKEHAYSFVWSPTITRSHQIDAALRAAVHAGKCKIVNLQTGGIQLVTVSEDARRSIFANLTKDRSIHTPKAMDDVFESTGAASST